MNVLVANTKGGVGKTTLAVQLAIWRARQGRRVWLVDDDPQGSSMSAITHRNNEEIAPAIACSRYDEPKQLLQQVRLQKEGYDDVVIDVGGRHTVSLRYGLMLCDAALVPFAPMALDLWAMEDMARVVEEVRIENENLVAYAVMNQAEARLRSTDNAEAAEMVRGIKAFAYLDAPLVKRKAFSVATGSGRMVAEMPHPDPRAVVELERLAGMIFECKLKG